MRWLDDLLAVFAPSAALQRELARQSLAQLRAYEAAGRPRKWESWRRPATSATQEVRQAPQVRAAVRDLVRNNGYAQRALRTLTRATIGSGITGALVRPDGSPSTPAARDMWDRWADQCDHEGHSDLYGLQLQAVRAYFESGDALIQILPWPDAPPRVPPMQLRVLEPDWIDTDKNDDRNSERLIDRGIEYDAQGRKVAYWLLPHHPGDLSRLLRLQRDSVRVPVQQLVHIYDRLRPGQDRGVSIFAAAAAPLKDLQDYYEAEAMRKRIEACLAVFVTSGDDMKPVLGIDDVPDPQTGAPSTRLMPGMIQHLRPGEGIQVATPQGGAEVTPFADQMLFLAAAAGGVMFEHLTGNMKYVNYSSYRVGAYDFAGFIEQQQWLVLHPRLQQIGRSFVDMARLIAPNFPASARVRWTPPPAVTSPDPEKEARADMLDLRLGKVAPSELAERRGWSHAELLQRIKSDLDLHDSIGLMFDGDPRKLVKGPNRGGTTQDIPERNPTEG